ncbi:MAG: 50S ribosomal protein L4 [Parcubacteria group bacterium ADurb.Bin316]|nr:MAG: 50S ribosomal protein L4 [Parcubacteria group bacterium ADurb.Bin316]HOZ56063.1 50S ribosomal protein L4 [bacterium]
MGIKLNVYNQAASKAGTVELSEKVFGLKVNESLVHQAMVTQMGNERQVLAHTKDRSEVRGGGRKPWRQKGTGRARVGSSRSPLWIGGGVTFGPTKDRNFKKKINRKMKQQAICMVLSDRVSNDSLVILDKLDVKEYKTKTINEIFKNIESKVLSKQNDKKAKRSILIINDDKGEEFKYSVRNLAGIKNINLENINIIDLLNHQNLIVTENVVKKLEALYGGKTK